MLLEWLGHAGFRISAGKTVYIDPFQISSGKKADIILVTHPHYDHCSVEDIKKIVAPETIIVAPIDCQGKIASGKVHYSEFRNLAPGSHAAVYGCSIYAVPAYNKGKPFHKRADEWCGYVIEINGKKFYHAGDTDLIDEMAGIRADVALLPVGGTYTMTAREAAQAAAIMKPKLAIPMHYGSIVGSASDAELFRNSVANSRVEILGKNSPIEID